MNIVLCYPVEEQHIAQIKAALPEATVLAAGQNDIPEAILEADIYCGHAKARPIDWETVVQRGRLRWIQSSAAGMDHCLTPAVINSEIIVTSASGVLADQVADHTLALMAGLARSLPTFFRAQQKKEFVRRPTRDLHRSTIGIVGFGGNGRRLAEVLRVFKTRILATDYYPVDKPDYVAELWPPERLDELLPEVDYLILAAPLNDQTRHMINANKLALMKPTSFLINVARGQLVVEADLIDALKSGKLAGAGLDVTATEPLSTSSGLWDLPNVIITPHVGGQSARRIEDMTDFFARTCDVGVHSNR